MENNNSIQKVSKEELSLINSYTRKELTENDVYTFSVVLCDNDVDRDFEYFTGDTLETLSKMFEGVTGIYDHDPKAKNQVARIYSCKTENLSPKKTAYGEDYIRLVAKAYLPRCEGNNDFIAMLDSGIKKEVSVGCGIEECSCSICGEDMRRKSCGHIKGEYYKGKMCCGVLKNPTDAYEWSFTAVPAQRKAGVIKSFCKGDDERVVDRFLKSVNGRSGEIVVDREEVESLKKYVEALKSKAEENGKYKAFLQLETVKTGVTAKLGIESDLLESMVRGLSIDELLRLKETFEKKKAEILPVRSQVFGQFGESRSETENAYFNI